MDGRSDDFFLRIGYWLETHRTRLRRWWVVSILVVDGILLVYFITAITGYFVTTEKTVRTVHAMSEPLVSLALRQALTPLPLEIGTAVALPLGGNRYDFAVPVINPNEAWAATLVRYTFTFGSVTREEKTTIWPHTRTYLTQLNSAVTAPPNTGTPPTVTVTGIDWIRPINPRIYTDDVSFPVTNPSLRPITGLSSGGTATRYSATVQNMSVYTLRHVRFLVIAEQSGRITGVGESTVDEFLPSATQTIEVTWLRAIPLNSMVTVVPVVDLSDPATYL